jgi:hypothetical protein
LYVSSHCIFFLWCFLCFSSFMFYIFFMTMTCSTFHCLVTVLGIYGMNIYVCMYVEIHKESSNIINNKEAVIIEMSLHHHQTNKQFIQFYISEAHACKCPVNSNFSPKKFHSCGTNVRFFRKVLLVCKHHIT